MYIVRKIHNFGIYGYTVNSSLEITYELFNKSKPSADIVFIFLDVKLQIRLIPGQFYFFLHWKCNIICEWTWALVCIQNISIGLLLFRNLKNEGRVNYRAKDFLCDNGWTDLENGGELSVQRYSRACYLVIEYIQEIETVSIVL